MYVTKNCPNPQVLSGPPSFGYDWGGFDDGDVGDGYPLINIQRWKITMRFSWVNQLFRLGHFQYQTVNVYQRVDYWVYHIYYIQTHPNSSKPRNDLTPETEKNLGSLTCGSSCGWIKKKKLQCHHCRGWEIPETIEVAGKIQLWWTFQRFLLFSHWQ